LLEPSPAVEEPSATSSSCARFFLGDDTCSLSKMSSFRSPGSVSGVACRAVLESLSLSWGAESLASSSSSSEGARCWLGPAFSEMEVCLSSRLAAVVSASSFAVLLTGSDTSLVMCGSSAMMSAVSAWLACCCAPRRVCVRSVVLCLNWPWQTRFSANKQSARFLFRPDEGRNRKAKRPNQNGKMGDAQGQSNSRNLHSGGEWRRSSKSQ